MQRDARDLALSASSAEAAALFDTVVEHYVKYRADTAQLVGQLIAADPEFALGHCLKGYFTLLSCKAANVAAAGACLEAARLHSGNATVRERQHIEALAHWRSGDVEAALATWERILAVHPLDLVALRLAHFSYFWRGEARAMRDSVLRTEPAWSSTVPGYGTWLAMAAFGQEECGEYGMAERSARRAVELDPADLWATHAVAHVLEMQGRPQEGVGFLAEQEAHWEGANNMAHHLAWHRALYHLELDDFEAVLLLYDRRVRPLDSALVQAQPDLYIDIQNAASLLWRLELLGVAVGSRWAELADRAEGRIGDHVQLFTLPHFMMTLAADQRWQACARMLEALRREGAAGASPDARILGDLALPACEAVIAHRRGEHGRVVALLAPVRDALWRLGASHAQRDLFDQMLADSAQISGRVEVLTALLPKLAIGRGRPPEERKAYARVGQLTS